jgi:uncharacterized protein YjbJ (UPF0337 family)
MSKTSDKVKGSLIQVAGKVKQGVGKATDDATHKGEGKVQDATSAEMLAEFKSALAQEKRSPT